MKKSFDISLGTASLKEPNSMFFTENTISIQSKDTHTQSGDHYLSNLVYYQEQVQKNAKEKEEKIIDYVPENDLLSNKIPQFFTAIEEKMEIFNFEEKK